MAPPPATVRIGHDPIDDLPIGNNVNRFDANVIVVVLAVLLSAIICSLVLNSIIKCAFRCSTLILADSSLNHTNNKGINQKALKTFPITTYSTKLKHRGSTLSVSFAYPNLELERKLRYCLIDTCQKIVNGHSSVTTNAILSARVEDIVIRIEPLEREGVISNQQIQT
ncbi:putative RING-H2 finger protein ATL78-like [Capsicum annuum]|nr:putative RING-H2 finger protein ATL78-like [Capsicum annuum]KAF3684364.1 putative RING-H2 finger protein ATL78-like [Capsicum annuum]